ncbi:MAG: hypothetical protein JEY94_10730 [Melioribacteraceae bacterium]|nr:hypothetical protein [Melioribacteraceae bacterium]
MKRLILLIIICSINISAQDFKVDKVSGTVKMLRGTSENWENVTSGKKLNSTDLIVTEEKSFIKISNNTTNFVLESNSAIDISKVKNMSMDDLLLALAMEDIRAIPQKDSKSNVKNTAVYGENKGVEKSVEATEATSVYLGVKLLNGAKQLAKSGYKESALVTARETYRKHPSTLTNFNDRIYFTDILIDLRLFSEANEELQSLGKLELSEKNKNQLHSKLEKIKIALLEK